MKKILSLAILFCMATLITFAGNRKSGAFTVIINDEQADYKGDYIFVNGANLPDGSGKLTYVNGNVFSGKFVQGKMEGKGTLKYKDGRKYEGQFVNGLMEGKGTLTYKDGSKYVGEFKAGKKHGRGVQTDKAGNKYEGEFVNDLPAPVAIKQ